MTSLHPHISMAVIACQVWDMQFIIRRHKKAPN